MIRPKILFFATCLFCLMALLVAIRVNSNKDIHSEEPAIAVDRVALRGERFSDVQGGEPYHNRRYIWPRASESTSAPEQPSGLQAAPTNALPNELIVKLKPGVTNIDEIAAVLGAKVTGRMDKLGAYRLEFTDADVADAARQQLTANADVDSLDSNYSIDRLPTGQELGGNYEASKLTVTPGDSNGKIVVGLIDTAVQVESSGLDKSFFLPSISVAGESVSDANTLTHGTSMAEAILQGLSSVEAGKSETSLRILSVDVYGNSESTTTYQVAQGIVEAIANGATIINLSLGSDGDSSVLQQVIADAHAQGIIFFSAAGNEPVTTATYPAAYSEVVAVTATDNQGNIASYANYGDFVDIATPGTVVVSYNGKSYLVTGTSASTALASGAAAGVAEKTGASTTQVEATIRQGLAAP